MKGFKERLVERINDKKSIVCVGLDPDTQSKQFLSLKDHDHKTKIGFCIDLIDAVHDIVPCVKINTRFFMPDEWRILQEIVDYAHSKDLIVIGDCKQNDIGNTMAMAYKKEFGTFNWDVITVNAYFGIDGICGNGIFDEWFEKGKGLFVLVKTSNKSSYEIQDLEIAPGIPIYLKMAQLVEEWNSEYNGVIGGVVGATDLKNYHGDVLATASEMIGQISDIMNGILLIPGYGAQGGSASALQSLDEGKYCIVNSSRGIMYAYDRRFKGKYKPFEYEKAARAEVEFMNEDLNKHFKGFN